MPVPVARFTTRIFDVAMICRKTPAVLTLALIGLTPSCKDSKMPATTRSGNLSACLPDSFAGRLSQQTIYFGHQSVGYNILDGIRDLARDCPSLALNISETSDLRTLRAPFLAHSRIGRNGQPVSKVEDFSNAFRQRGEPAVDIAFMKFCYTDFTELADVSSAFRSYAETLAALKKSSPRTMFVHVTTPLTAPVNPLKVFVKNVLKRALGKPVTGYESKRAIAAFNELIRNTYLGKEPVFDLASIESTHADGTRVMSREVGTVVYSLAPEYTFDGGHLNEKGRRIVALELLRFLAALPEKAPLK